MEPVIPWKTSQAKVHLLKKLTLGDLNSNPVCIKPPAEVWTSSDELCPYPKKNVCDAIRRYKKTILLQRECISFEDNATEQHWISFCGSTINSRGKLKLHNNIAKNLLELDVAAGRAKGRKPAEIKKDRPEYAEFGTNQWRSAVNNEWQKQKSEIWYVKRNKEGALRHIKHRETQLKEAGILPQH